MMIDEDEDEGEEKEDKEEEDEILVELRNVPSNEGILLFTTIG